MAMELLSETLRTALESGFSLELIRQDLPERAGEPATEGAVPNLETLLRAVALEGETIPAEAGGLILLLLYRQNFREHGENDLHALLERAFAQKRLPTLHCAQNTEQLATAELCAWLSEIRPLTTAEMTFVMNRRAVSLGLAAYVWLEADKYIKTADICAALTLEAVRGELGAFDARLHELARPFPGQIAAAANVRRLVQNSGMTTEEGRRAFGYDTHPRVQDAISLRAMPQTHGGVRDVHTWLGENLTAELAGDLRGEGVLMEYSLDFLATALADLGNISEERTFRLTEKAFSYGLPTNLVFHQGYNHGYPVVQACQAAMLAELKLLALPAAAVKTGAECMTYDCALRLMKALPLLCKVLATEVLMAAQGMSIVQDALPDFSFGKGTKAVLAEFRRSVEVLIENRFVAPDMVKADELVADGTILAAAELAVGVLQ